MPDKKEVTLVESSCQPTGAMDSIWPTVLDKPCLGGFIVWEDSFQKLDY